MKNKFLLSDESTISKKDYDERYILYKQFIKMPESFFSKLRHFQPQIGCLNSCSICSKYASTNVSEWNEERIRNVIAAIKYSTPRHEKPLIVWDRNNHRNGVIFSYLDNDVGFYKNLDSFIEILYRELGVKTRISTVGFSRHNSYLNKMHSRISNYQEKLGGVRLSFTPYTIGWACNNTLFDRKEYEKDMINFLKIYKTYYDYIGSGSRKFCIELRYKPFVVIDEVIMFNYNQRKIIYVDKYLFVSKDKNIRFKNTKIKDPFNHRLSLDNDGLVFDKIVLTKRLNSKKEIIDYLNNHYDVEKNVTIYRVKNRDGYYYSINPVMNDSGSYGLYIYPKTENRLRSGYINVERYFLNSIFEYKKKMNLSSRDQFIDASWDDVNNVVNLIKKKTINRDEREVEYINNEILPMINTYINVLKKSNYSPSVFFDKNFTIDTGIICNLGRAIHEFKGLVSVENEPLTLNHERNYGNSNSTMTVEGSVWRLSCDYNDTIILELLDLADTASSDGQTKSKIKIKLDSKDNKISFKDIKGNYYIPGQREMI
ncbi:MAG: hypothetical protein IJH20_00885 [Bacilli bacterium]|nr:hypothetical protein [Bacilli bacterium]